MCRLFWGSTVQIYIRTIFFPIALWRSYLNYLEKKEYTGVTRSRHRISVNAKENLKEGQYIHIP